MNEVEHRASTSSSRPSLQLPALEPISNSRSLLDQPDSDSDHFLQTRSHVPLDELRGDLRSHLNTLREELVQLINEDYEEFIALGVGLRGEVQRLERLEAPIQDLQEELRAVSTALEEHEASLRSTLIARSELRDEWDMLTTMQKLLDAITRTETLLDGIQQTHRMKDIHRIGSEYSQIRYLQGKLEAEGWSITQTIEPRLRQIKMKIESELATVLLEACERRSGTSFRDCLKVYDAIEAWKQAQATVSQIMLGICDEIIQPSKINIPATPTAPQTPHSARNPFDKLSEETPLATMYNRVLDKVQDLCLLIDTAEEVSPYFALLEEVIVPRIATAIRVNLGRSIFLAGRPEELHKNFVITAQFFGALENLASSPAGVLAMRNGQEMISLNRQWQLPVYFQLRWKDIVIRLEKALEQAAINPEWSLPQSSAIWQAIQTCWSADVYLAELGDRFWRLHLQILARYRNSLQQVIPSLGNSADVLNDDTVLRFAIKAVMDIERMRMRLLDIPNLRQVDYRPVDLLPAEMYTEKITQILSARCAEQLKPIRAVASQLRTTNNRQRQASSSTYIQTVFHPLRTLVSEYKSFPSAQTQIVARYVTAYVFAQFATLLLSVRKTEDLLRRHRKGKKAGFSLFGSGGASEGVDDGDEEGRFDAQMRLDIDTLGKEAKTFGVEVDDLPEWRELKDAMEKPLDKAGE